MALSLQKVHVVAIWLVIASGFCPLDTSRKRLLYMVLPLDSGTRFAKLFGQQDNQRGLSLDNGTMAALTNWRNKLAVSTNL
jgi:hypothetical protein